MPNASLLSSLPQLAVAIACWAAPAVVLGQTMGPNSPPPAGPKATPTATPSASASPNTAASNTKPANENRPVGEGTTARSENESSRRWQLVLSQWSMRGSALRNRNADAPSAVIALVEAASGLSKRRIELSSQLLNADANFVPKSPSDQERKADEPRSLRDTLEGTAHAQISIDHLPPLSVGIDKPPKTAVENSDRTADSDRTDNNIGLYADWIMRAESSLGIRTFSLLAAEHEHLREPAKVKAVESLIALAERLTAARENAAAPKETEDAPARLEKTGASVGKDGSGTQPPSQVKPRSAEKSTADKPAPGTPKRASVKWRILIESGDGFRSEPQWLADVVRDARKALVDHGIQGIDFQILFNLGRRRPEEINPAKLWQPLGYGTKESPYLAGVVAETAAFVVVPGESEGKVRVVAERRIDYAEALQAMSPFAGDEVLVVVRYIGPEQFETEGITASLALFNMLLDAAPPTAASSVEPRRTILKKE